MYVELHASSAFSFLQAASLPEALVDRAASLGYPALALLDRDGVYGAPRFHKAALAAGITDRTKIIYLANPNNPTGTIFTKEEFDSFYAAVPERVLIILDEAYFEYAVGNPEYPDSMNYRYDNVITLRTFSKIYGLAGLRLGFAVAQPDIAHRIALALGPWACSGPALTIALNGFMYWKSDSLALRASGARELGLGEAPRLRQIVTDLSANLDRIEKMAAESTRIVSSSLVTGWS